MVFTSNRDPAQWKENFCENDALLCALDRIFDDAVVLPLRGERSGGRKLETVALRTSTGSPADPQQAGVNNTTWGLATPDGDFRLTKMAISPDPEWLISPDPNSV